MSLSEPDIEVLINVSYSVCKTSDYAHTGCVIFAEQNLFLRLIHYYAGI